MNSPAHESKLWQHGETWLIEQVAAGDQCAFEALYRLYFPRLTRFLGRMTRNAQLIEEVVNDAMLVVWQKAPTFDGSCKLSTWVFAIAYRKACKALHAQDEPHGECPDDCEAGAECLPERLFELACLDHAVGAALDCLPLAQRAAFQLAFYHDMGYAEIAGVMDCPVNTVKTRVFHARRRLAQLLVTQMEART